MKGYLGKYQDMGVTIYLTPDGKHAISGYMYNEKGENLSNTLIEKEFTHQPDAKCGNGWNNPTGSSTVKKMRRSLSTSSPIRSAHIVNSFWQQARPWVDSGKVQLRTLLVGVIKPESPATAAAILASKDPAKTWQQYEASGGKLKLNVPANVSTEQMKVLSDNEKLMDDLGANVTPAIYYMSKENTLQQAVGLPDQKTLNIIMGNK
ncbi:disulfide isomerase/thiol-disulfide oxidase [Escherichia coli]|uniref:Disulfide isomerase/thiol-disulfide oxidase n=1 Tax=Escherichia coli TaxID=562 RepID=A0A376RP69_ECOLX|nr:disulfide isomerase/thiol-disulfide oxidase [Escherichia coli]